MRLTDRIRRQADVTHVIKSLDEIPLKNMLRRIAEAWLRERGFYTYNQDGKKHLIFMEV